jgi:hypothetical protein
MQMMFANQESVNTQARGAKPSGLDDIEKIMLRIGSVQAVSKSGRIDTLTNQSSGSISTSVVDSEIDLLKLNDGLSIFSGNIQADIYKQFRIVSPSVEKGADVDSNVYIVKKDSTIVPVKLPSGSTSGFKLVIDEPVDLSPDSAVSIFIDFDMEKSIVRTGNGKYILKPVVKTRIVKNSSSSSGNL